MQDFLNPQGTPRDHSQPLKKGDALWDRYFPPKKEVKKKRNYEEAALQKSCISWFRKQYPHLWRMLFMCKNDGNKRKIQSQKTGVWFSPDAQRDAAQGIVPGISDLLFLLSNHKYSGWCIEMKTSVGSQSQEQIVFEMMATASGKKYSIIRKLDEFIYETEDYMKTVSAEVLEKIKFYEERYQAEASFRTVKKLNK